MGPLPQMPDALNQYFNWRRTNVPELEQPLLIILDYSPKDDSPPLSIAFDYSNGPKCWLSESKVRKIGVIGPKPHSKYGQFTFEGRRFYPYSIVALPSNSFKDIQVLMSTCQQLYKHVDWS